MLLLSHHLLLLEKSLLIRGHLLLHLLLVDHALWHLTLSRLLLLHLVTIAVVALSSLSSVGATTIVVVVISFVLVAARTLVPLTLVIILTVLSVTTVVVVAVALHTVTGLSANGMLVEVLHKVLLNLVEAALLTLLVQLLGGHPELDGEGAGAERCRLIEALNGTLGTFDVSVEDEILSIGCVGIKIFSLTQFN